MEEFINTFKKDDIINFSKTLSKLSPLEFSSLGCIIGIILCEILNPNEQNTIGNFLELVGQILLTSYAQASIIDPNFSSPSRCQFNNLKIDVEKIKKQIIKLNQNKY